jgi:hypothetical protein
MSETALQDAYATLKLTMDANLATVESAYAQHKELFNCSSMACYSLCSEAEQQASLKLVESAHQLIIRECFPQQTEPAPEPASVREGSIAAATPAPGVSPGSFLKQQREKLGLPLTAIVDQIKVSKTILGHIEQEDYAQLPATVYLRGFIIEFAKIVYAADPRQLASEYLEQMCQEGPSA